jgi:hypothetical protein
VLVTLSCCIERGLQYLWSRQSSEGFWSDWNLPPGASRMWTTAYIGYRLSSLPAGWQGWVDEPLMRAETWLRAAEFRSGGWGYSEETGPDADSTALAILFLTARGGPIAERPVRRLVAHQQTDGGFSTYTSEPSFGTWVQSHPEVTAVAALALRRVPHVGRTTVARAVRYVLDHRRPDGLWNAFWWKSSIYATEASLALVNADEHSLGPERVRRSLLLAADLSAFDRALRLLCLIYAGADAASAERDAAALCAAQSLDGSWPSTPVLRLTARDCCEPWRVDGAGPLFADERRQFTTATVVAALGRYSTCRI